MGKSIVTQVNNKLRNEQRIIHDWENSREKENQWVRWAKNSFFPRTIFHPTAPHKTN